MLRILIGFLLLAALPALSQVSAPQGDVPQRQPAAAPQTVPMSYPLSQSLGQLNTFALSAVRDLGQVRVDKWKTDGRTKDQTRENIESLQRNLTAALPTLTQQIRANPSSVAALVRLYRNLNAVYDVLSSVTESSGAFGSKEDYNALATDTANLDTIRRSLADQLEQMAANQEAQITRLTEQIKVQQAQAASTPPKKVVVDDTTPAKKSVPKKKSPPKTQ